MPRDVDQVAGGGGGGVEGVLVLLKPHSLTPGRVRQRQGKGRDY